MAGLWRIKERVKILTTWTIITILFTYFAIKFFGLRGAGMGFWISYLILWCLSFPYLSEISRFSLQWKFIIKNLIILSILGGVIYFWKNYIWLYKGNRREIIKWLIGISIIYIFCLTGSNWGKIKILKKEIKSIAWKDWKDKEKK